ncbi:MAG: glucokinase [Ktedonobacterales bacterium]
MLLAGDIGGTKTTLAAYGTSADPRTPLVETTYPSGQYASLEDIVRAFAAQTRLQFDRASFGVAGPVFEGTASVTNLQWQLDERRLSAALGIPTVRLMNDLEAIAHAVPLLAAGDLHTLNAGAPSECAHTLAVIAPGTGLGEAFITRDGERLNIHPSEGGHCDFAPTDTLQDGLLAYLQRDEQHVSYERVCSGIGIPNIYAYLKASSAADEPAWLVEQLAAADDLAPVIVQAALDEQRPSPLCVATVNTFVAVLGAEAGNLALKVLATGGVYIGGGIPPRILRFLEDPRFLRAFKRKGRFGDLLARTPVHVILNPKVALLGAAQHGLRAG